MKFSEIHAIDLVDMDGDGLQGYRHRQALLVARSNRRPGSERRSGALLVPPGPRRERRRRLRAVSHRRRRPASARRSSRPTSTATSSRTSSSATSAARSCTCTKRKACRARSGRRPSRSARVQSSAGAVLRGCPPPSYLTCSIGTPSMNSPSITPMPFFTRTLSHVRDSALVRAASAARVCACGAIASFM